MMNAEEWIQKLGLEEHPEGGYFRENYRSDLPTQEGQRVLMTSIYFLLKGNQVSKFHRLQSDEIWYFHAGSPLKIHMIASSGEWSTVKLSVEDGEGFPQVLISKNTWFAAEVLDKNSYSLVGCVVSPGFEFKDFELASEGHLISDYPEHETVIRQFV